jgi:hypothetical protein
MLIDCTSTGQLSDERYGYHFTAFMLPYAIHAKKAGAIPPCFSVERQPFFMLAAASL